MVLSGSELTPISDSLSNTMAPSARRRGSSPGPGSSSLSGTASLAAGTVPSETSSLNESYVSAQARQIPGSPAPSWREKVYSSLHLKRPGPPKHDADWERTRSRVREAVESLVQVAGDNILPIASTALGLAPLPGLSVAAEILNHIWESVQTVQTNRSRCLRLTERCADLLLAIHEIVLESGQDVADELQMPLERISESFLDFQRFLREQTESSFFTRYLHKDEILQQIDQHDTAVRDCLYLFHSSISLRILKRVLKPAVQNAPLLLAPLESTEPSQLHHDNNLDALDLPNLRTETGNTVTADDVSSLSERLRQVQENENKSDHARDNEELGRVLHAALNAPSHLAVTRILQISKPEMPAAIVLLLRELERQQAEQHTANSEGAQSPSPRIRALTWPLDGAPARQVALLHRQFLEYELEALRRTSQAYGIPASPVSPALLNGNFWRTEIQVSPPSEHGSLSSTELSETVITTPNTKEKLLDEDFTLDNGTVQTRQLGPALERPSDPFETATELRYRLSLSHAFHHLSVSLPLWSPTRVDVGAVGYLTKSSGAFRTLFSSLRPLATSQGRLTGVPPLTGVPILYEKQTQDAGIRAKSLKLLDKLTPSAPSPLKRSYDISAFGDTARLIVEKAEYRYFHSLDAPKRWFRTHVQAIMDVYGTECLKEDLFLVSGTLDARDHAMLVNHGHPDQLLETQFHVYSSRIPGQDWGYFEPRKSSSDEDKLVVRKVSVVDENWHTVLLSRLRFRPAEHESSSRAEEQEPTTQ